MKRIGYIYEKICDVNNIRKALHSASKGKKYKRNVKRIFKNENYYIEQIRLMLVNKTYKPSPYIESVIHDGMNKKQRTIHKPKFYPDQIIHWCLMNQIDHLMMRGMYKWSCASIPGRGTHYAKNGVQKWLRTDKKNTKYCIKLDIKKYYPNVDNKLLKSKFRKLIKCKDALNLIDLIVDSNEKGLPIGNYTSQWFANFYLQDIDHYIKQELKVKYYIRYMDDLVLLGSNKKKLRKAFQLLTLKLKEYGLEIKNNHQLFRIEKRSLDFVGFTLNHHKTFIRKRITLRCRRAAMRYKQKPTLKGAYALASYQGWYKHSNSYILEKKYFYEDKTIYKIKEKISNESRKTLINDTRYRTNQIQT